MVSVKNIKTWMVVAILIAGCFFIGLFRTVRVNLTNSNEGRTEIMLWNYTRTSFDSRLNLQFDIQPKRDLINIAYKITNISDKTIITNNTLDFVLVEANERKAGNPGKTVWSLSKSGNGVGLKPIKIEPNGVFKDNIRIDRQKVGLYKGQYYISGYFDGEFISQYKIIEGVLK